MINRNESALIARERRNQANRGRRSAEPTSQNASKAKRRVPKTTH